MNKFLITNKNALNDYDHYDYHPKNTMELRNTIIKLLKQGITDLNCIDVSKITTMSWLFSYVNEFVPIKDIDISEWDVSNVKFMGCMFYGCKKFNADLSKWNVYNVTHDEMYCMFDGCNSLTKIPDWYKYE